MFTTSSSEIGHSSMPDLKYQKAIKEIGKLVNINTALKKQISAAQQKYDTLRGDYENLRECYEHLEAASQERIGKEQKTERDSEIDKTAILNELNGNKIRIEELEQQLLQKETKISELELILENKHGQYIDLEEKCVGLQEEFDLQMQKLKSRNFQKLEKQKKQVQKSLQISQKWGLQLSKDIQNLKKQSVLFNLNKASSIKSSLEIIASSGQKTNSNQLKSQKGIGRDQDRQIYKKMKKQLTYLRENRQEQDKKIADLTQFITKQQNYIERFSTPSPSHYQFGLYQN